MFLLSFVRPNESKSRNSYYSRSQASAYTEETQRQTLDRITLRIILYIEFRRCLRLRVVGSTFNNTLQHLLYNQENHKNLIKGGQQRESNFPNANMVAVTTEPNMLGERK